MEKAKPLVFTLSFFWSLLNWARRRLLRNPYVVTVPSVLVGNLQAGGAGKTPVVIAIALEAVKRGKKVAVISRGYGSGQKFKIILPGEAVKFFEVGDESTEIKQAVPEIILGVGSARLKVILAIEKTKPDLIIFDDGFQNLSFKAGFNVIAVTDRQRNEVVYRDFYSEIQFADIILGTKGNAYPEQLKNNGVKFFELEWEWLNPISQPVWVLCGIADPSELKSFYESRGLKISRFIAMPDHHLWQIDHVKKLLQEAHQAGCKLAMTEKDRVKIPSISNEIYILNRRIKNRDWLECLFNRTLN